MANMNKWSLVLYLGNKRIKHSEPPSFALGTDLVAVLT